MIRGRPRGKLEQFSVTEKRPISKRSKNPVSIWPRERSTNGCATPEIAVHQTRLADVTV